MIGVLLAVLCLVAATTQFPGGFDWNRDFVSTLLRGPAGPARTLADIGVLLFCVSLATVFGRLAKLSIFSDSSKFIRIGGIGSQVYAAFTITPMHDVMVTISLVFLLVALIPMVRSLFIGGEKRFSVVGCVAVGLLGISAAIYYSSHLVTVLPWAQRVSFGISAGWLVALDLNLPRGNAQPRRGEETKPH